MRISVTVILIFSLHCLFAQPGCTDPQAINFDSNANENDGSCLYVPTDYTLTELALLPESLKECSGLEYFNSSLWIHNDGGNEDKIYRIDSLNGAILQSVIIGTADNLDWEDLTENDTFLYIGDVGNNPGNRIDLTIHRVVKNDLSNVVVDADIIEFEYNDQTDFSVNHNNNDFDCEALLYFDDSLHLFTKNWVDNQTKHYILPAETGNHVAQLRETFNVGGLITSVDISDQGEIALLGYTELGSNFMWLLFDFEGSNFFSGNKRKISLGNGLQNSQTEGLSFRDNGNGYICSEEFKVTDQIILPQKLLAFSIDQWLNPINPIREDPLKGLLRISPNPFHNSFKIENLLEKNLAWQLFNGKGQLLTTGNSNKPKIPIPASNLIPENLFPYRFLKRPFSYLQLNPPLKKGIPVNRIPFSTIISQV